MSPMCNFVGVLGHLGANCSLGKVGKTEIPRKAFRFFESSSFLSKQKGQERSCVCSPWAALQG